MMGIPFVQYLRPDGRRRHTSIERGPATEAKAAVILRAGYVFECEELSTGHASFTIHDPRDEEDVAIEICLNGPEVPATVDKLIEKFVIPARHIAETILQREARRAVLAMFAFGPGLLLLAGCKDNIAHAQQVFDSWLGGVILIVIALAGIGVAIWPRRALGVCPHQHADGEASALGRCEP